jgi:hypothetical protein
MDSATLERCIHNLGSSYDLLVAIGVIPSRPLQNVYEGNESLVVDVEDGLELLFQAETKRLEEIVITLGAGLGEDQPVYSGEMPKRYSSLTTQANVLAILGPPLESRGRVEFPGTQITMGGWDTYQVPASLHEAVFVDFQYNEDLCIDRITFALIARN